MSTAVSGIMIGRSRIVVAAQGCKTCGVEFSERWHEQKVPIIVAGKRYFLQVPICDACAPHVPPHSHCNPPNESTFPPAEVGHL